MAIDFFFLLNLPKKSNKKNYLLKRQNKYKRNNNIAPI